MIKLKEKSKMFSPIDIKPEQNDTKKNKSRSKGKVSERLELKFWNEMRKINPPNDRMEIYAEKIRKGLIYKGNILKIYENEEDKMKRKKRENEKKELDKMEVYLNQKNKENNTKSNESNSSKKTDENKLALKWKILIALLILIVIAGVVLLCLFFFS